MKGSTEQTFPILQSAIARPTSSEADAEKHIRRDEEVSFGKTLAKGLERFKKAKAAASGTLLSGRDAFELYDTFGFPADLTQVQTLAHHLGVTFTCRPLRIAKAGFVASRFYKELTALGVLRKMILDLTKNPLLWPCSRPPVGVARARR